MRGVVMAVALLVLAALPARAETMYARTATPVRANRTLSAATLGTLQQGEAVQVGAREDTYFRVTYKGQAGYVYYNKLAAQKPENVGALLAAAPGAQGVKLTELQAGGALRGLSPMAENYARDSQVPAWAVQAVEAMQARPVSAQQLDAFQKEGRLGEYGEGG